MVWEEARRTRTCYPVRMRIFHDIIPMGCGDLSATDLDVLRGRLEDAISTVGGLQQPDHPTSDEHAATCRANREDAKADLLDAARDILAAIGVRVIGNLEA